MKAVDKVDPLPDGFTHFQLVQKTKNTRTQYMSVNITLPPQEQFLSAQHIHIDTAIAKAILKKGTRGSFHHWVQDDFDLAVTMLQKPHALGGFGLTPNVLAQISAKVTMTSRFLQLVGSLPAEEQKLWFLNQLVHDSDSCHSPHLLNLKKGYDVLINKHDYKVQEMYTVQDYPLLLMNLSYCLLSIVFTRLMCEIRSYLSRGSLDRLSHRLKTHFLTR